MVDFNGTKSINKDLEPVEIDVKGIEGCGDNISDVRTNQACEREICPHDEFCGGCIYQGIPYEAQLNIKEKQVEELLEAKKVSPDRVDKIEGCETAYNYRNKMEYTFGDFVKDGELTLGMHRKKSFMSIVTVDECQLVHSDFNKILVGVLGFCKYKGYLAYHKKSHKGLMRNLVIRRGVYSKEILVNIVTASDEAGGASFDNAEFVEMLKKLDLDHNLVGVLRTINDSLADAVIPEKVEILWGQDYYMEEILGLKFKVSAFSFFQTNVKAAERLYRQAIDLIDALDGKRVFDLYCGTGTISQILALKAKDVLGIELVEEAVEAAKANAELNGLDNCKFIAGDVFEVLSGVEEKPDVIVVDPPRVGIQPKALDKIISYGVKEIVYVSCNPKTLAENLKYLEYYGYKVRYLKPFDNFPMTKHVETVVLLSKTKA